MRNSFDNIDDAYRELLPALIDYASRRLKRKDSAHDAAHDAFVKTLEYLSRHPGNKISKFLLYRETARACRRLNQKQLFEIDPGADYVERINTSGNKRKEPAKGSDEEAAEGLD